MLVIIHAMQYAWFSALNQAVTDPYCRVLMLNQRRARARHHN
jgi:hypothetical protein